MPEKRMTLDQAIAAPSKTDWQKVAATTEVDIRRQMIEDGEDPDPAPDPHALRVSYPPHRKQP